MIKQGNIVKIKPAFQDAGDDSIVWLAIEDEDGGRVRIEAQLPNMEIKPTQVVRVEWLA